MLRKTNHFFFQIFFLNYKFLGTAKNFFKSKIFLKSNTPSSLKYRKVASRSTCYYSENQVFGGATNQDMSLNKTCYYSENQEEIQRRFKTLIPLF